MNWVPLRPTLLYHIRQCSLSLGSCVEIVASALLVEYRSVTVEASVREVLCHKHQHIRHLTRFEQESLLLRFAKVGAKEAMASAMRMRPGCDVREYNRAPVRSVCTVLQPKKTSVTVKASIRRALSQKYQHIRHLTRREQDSLLLRLAQAGVKKAMASAMMMQQGRHKPVLKCTDH